MSDALYAKTVDMPLVAILRGITPAEAVPVADALVEKGFIFMEVTLNSPDWADSIRQIRAKHGDAILLGAGTVLTPEEVDQVKEVGGEAIISPNMNPIVIQRTKELGMLSIPGCYTPTECFTALDHGADIIKIFPADTLGVPFIKAISAVLPKGTKICPTGGVTIDNLSTFKAAGVAAMGMGSALYKVGKSVEDVAASAEAFVKAYQTA